MARGLIHGPPTFKGCALLMSLDSCHQLEGKGQYPYWSFVDLFCSNLLGAHSHARAFNDKYDHAWLIWPNPTDAGSPNSTVYTAIAVAVDGPVCAVDSCFARGLQKKPNIFWGSLAKWTERTFSPRIQGCPNAIIQQQIWVRRKRKELLYSTRH